MTKIIIVEDDPMICEIYQKKFMESGFEVLTASSGEQLLSLAKNEKVDVILLDLIMPKLNGFDVIKSIREGQYDPDIKIIVFSNLSQKEDREKAMKLGANGFIVKSDFAPSALVEEVKRQMNQFREEKRNEVRNIKGKDIGKEKDKNGKKKVLMIEDEEIFLEMFGDKLRQDGFEVDTATNGTIGLKKAMSGKYDIFIIDMILPGITGDEIVAKIKLEDSVKDIPIMIFSASVDVEAEQRMRDLGADEFFMKTQLIPSDLSKKIAEILDV